MIVATAGHVDHGKTSLVRQLTGVDTDRLEEEKRRGLSINLGFAYRQLEDGASVGFIDVPGHSRFINTMIAGVGAIDLAMLVVAVDDGPMPQTYEHLDVLRLLGVEHFILLLPKVDRVDVERVDEVENKCLSLLPDGTEVFRVSNISGEGIPQVQEFLDIHGRDWRRQNIKGRFRLSTDRAFHLKGAGLVVTGTAISGRVKTGASLLLQPGGHEVRVRGIHAQDKDAEWGSAGQRCALNISGSVTRQDIERGDWLVEEGSGPCTGRFDARFTLLPASPLSLRHLVPLKLYIGAKRLSAKLFLLRPPDKEGGLNPGDTSRVQLIVDGQVHCCRGDRYLLRDDSETVTLGGGVVLDPFAPQRGKVTEDRFAWLDALEIPSPQDALQELVVAQQRVIALDYLQRCWNLKEEELSELVVGDSMQLVEAGNERLLVAIAVWEDAAAHIVGVLEDWHRERPGELGIKPAQLKKQAQEQLVSASLFDPALLYLVRGKRLALTRGLLHIAGRKAELSGQDERHWRQLEGILREHGRKIPPLSEVQKACGLDDKQMATVVRRAVTEGRLVKLSEKRYALAGEMRGLAAAAVELGQAGGFTVIEYRDHVGCGRNIAIEILEYFDSIRFTQRREQLRIILDPELPHKNF